MTESLELSLRFLERHPEAAAATIEAQDPEIAAAYLEEAPARLAGPVVARMLPFYAGRCLQRLGAATIAGLLREMSTPVATVLLRRLPGRLREQVIQELPRRVASAIKLLQGYPVTSVGAWLDPMAPALPEEITVEHAWQRLCDEASDIERIVPVVNREGRLLGLVRSAALLSAEGGTLLTQLLEPAPHTLFARSDLFSVQEHEVWLQGDPALVVARDGRYLGLLRHADLRRGLRDTHEQPAQAGLAGSLLELADTYWAGASQLLEGSFGWLSPSRRHSREK